MDQAMNEQLFAIFASGSGLQSATVAQIAISKPQVNSIIDRLAVLAESMIPVELEPPSTPLPLTELETELKAVGERIKTSYLIQLDAYTDELDALVTHITERLDKLFDELSVASALTAVSAFSDVNSTIDTIAGTAFGVLDTVLSNVDSLLAEMLQALDDFSLESVELETLAEFELVLIQATNAIALGKSQIAEAINNETQGLSQMYSSYKQHAKAVSTQLLVSDDNLAGIVAQLAGPDLAALLNRTQ